jgi:hypothetical protein
MPDGRLSSFGVDGQMKIVNFARTAIIALAATVIAAVPVSVSAQELAPEHVALARQYVDLTDKAAIYEITLVEVGIETMRTLLAQNPDKYELVDQAITKTLDTYKAKKGELMDQFARVYAQRLTMEELQAIVEFYSTPVGQKLATVTSESNQDLQTVMNLYQINLRTEFFAQVRAELRAGGLNL